MSQICGAIVSKATDGIVFEYKPNSKSLEENIIYVILIGKFQRLRRRFVSSMSLEQMKQ